MFQAARRRDSAAKEIWSSLKVCFQGRSGVRVEASLPRTSVARRGGRPLPRTGRVRRSGGFPGVRSCFVGLAEDQPQAQFAPAESF
jgi:hypothetical protein